MRPRDEECEICHEDTTGKPVVDGATRMGPWAMMCLKCTMRYGYGLGVGRGQKYDADGKLVKGGFGATEDR